MSRKKITIKEGTITIGGTMITADPEGKVALSEILAALTAGGGNVNIDLPSAGGMPGGDPMGALPDVGTPPEGGPLPPEAEAEPHFPGETPAEHEAHEAAETPEEEAAEHAGGESEAEEKDEDKGGPPTPPPPPGKKEEEGEEEEEEKDEDGGNPFAEARNPADIAKLITEDIRVNNGMEFKKKSS